MVETQDIGSGMKDVFWVFLRLGCTSFGGPTAHLGYFHHEFVTRKRWIEAEAYADLVALCQMLPGPASSQVGMALGCFRAGLAGAVVAWLGFTLPSAILLVLFALGLQSLEAFWGTSFLHGLKLAAVSVVAYALWIMARQLCPDLKRALIALATAALVHFFPSPGLQVMILLGVGFLSSFWMHSTTGPSSHLKPLYKNRRGGGVCLILFFGLLGGLPFLAAHSGSLALQYFDRFYRAGALVFGGGHVVLPLLQAEFVPQGLVTKEAFMAGYGAAQAIPGPLFAFSAYLGAILQGPYSPVLGASLCLVAIFLPSFLLVMGVLPFWDLVKNSLRIRAALRGVNAAVVGLLLAAFYDPVCTSAVFEVKDVFWAAAGFILLAFWKWPSWAVVLLLAFLG